MKSSDRRSIYPPARRRRPSSGGVRNRQLLFVVSTCWAISSVRYLWYFNHESMYRFNDNAAGSQSEHPKRTVFPRVFLFAGESTAAPRIIKEEEGYFSPIPVSHLSERQQESREECIFRSWQTASHPNCNEIHTFSADALISILKRRKKNKFEGGSRIAFFWPNNGETFVYKTTLFKEEFDLMTYEKSRREAMAMEMVNTSVGIYGFCGMTSLTEYGDGGDLHTMIKKSVATIAPLKKLEYALNLTRAVASVHSIDAEDGYASLIQGDLDGRNIFFVRGHLKLIDFNNAIFIRWNDNTRRPCFPKMLPTRKKDIVEIAPERLRKATIDEKIDIYQLGCLLFGILTGAHPYHCDRPPGICNQGKWNDNTLTQLEVKMLKKKGTLPVLPKEIEKSRHPAISAIRDAMKRMLQQDAKGRPSAQEVANELDSEWKYLTR